MKSATYYYNKSENSTMIVDTYNIPGTIFQVRYSKGVALKIRVVRLKKKEVMSHSILAGLIHIKIVQKQVAVCP